MHPRALTASLALLALAVPSRAQLAQHQQRGDSQIVIGDGVSSKGSKLLYTGGNQAPFQAAMDALSLAGTQSGTVEVLPGTYVFDATVEVSASGLRIRGGPNARIVAGAGLDGPCLRFAASAEDALLEGLTLEDSRDPPPAGPTLIEVRADRFSLLQCRLRRWNRLPPPARSVSVQLGHAVEGGVEDALLQGNRFVVGRQAAGPSVPAISEATGVCMLASVGGSGLRMLANSFESAVATSAEPGGQLEAAVSLRDEVGALLTANTLTFLAARLGATPVPSAMLECTSTSDAGATLRLSFQGNFVENLSCASVLRVVGQDQAPARVAVTGNSFGRVADVVEGGIYLEHADGSLLEGNDFHVFSPDTQIAPAVRAFESQGIGVIGNAFVLSKSRAVWLSSCAEALIRGNRFAGNPAPAGEAFLHLDDVADASVVHNQFSAQHCPPCAFSNALGTVQVFFCGNTLPAGCGIPPSVPGITVVGCDAPGTGGNPSF